MPSTSEKFDLLDFHDATIDEITFQDGLIRIELGFANILDSHPHNPHPTAQCMENCTLIFTSVHKSEATLYSDSQEKTIPHPESLWPIGREILEAEEIKGTGFVLKGFHPLGWSEWLISCSGFRLRWSTFSGDAWFVNWPPK